MPATLAEATGELSLLAALLVGLALVWLWPRAEAGSTPVRVALALIVILAVVQLLMFRTVIEDAFITFRYAENLIQGNGPVFNASERVEGYSNFLWMVLLAGLGAWLPLPIPEIARWLGGLFTLAVIPLAYGLTLRATSSARSALLAALLTATAGSLLAHGAGGLETGLFAFLVLSTAALFDRGAFAGAGVASALATMARPEGLLVAASAIAVALASGSAGASRGRAARRLGLGFLSLVGPWTLWRWSWYGYLLPNSVAAKAGRDPWFQVASGAEDLLAFVLATPVMGIALAVAAFAAASGSRPREGPVPLLAVVSAVHIAFVVWTGSDWMPAWRYFAPILPAVAVLTICLLHGNERTRSMLGSRSAIAGVALLAVLSVGISRYHPNMLPGIRYMAHAVRSLSDIGRWLGRTLPEDAVIAAYANGALPYHAGTRVRVIDLFGLTDEHIARRGRRAPRGAAGHVAFDNAYILRREPLVITLLSRFAKEPSCAVHRVVRSRYEGVSFRFPGSTNPLGQYANLYVLRSRRDELVRRLSASPAVELAECP